MNTHCSLKQSRIGIAVFACLLACPMLAQQTPAQQAPARPAAAQATVAASGADEIIIRTGAIYRGKVVSATAKAVRIEIPGRGAFDVPREQIDSLKVTPPALIVKGIQAYERGSMKEAVATLKAAVFQFQGLDTDWAFKGLLAYAAASLADQNLPEAEKAYNSFLQWYPDNDNVRDALIGLAEVDIARKQFDGALTNLSAMAESYDSMLKPEGNQLRQAARLNYMIAQCYAGLNRPEDALDVYTKIVALYPDPDFYPKALYEAGLTAARLGRLQRANLLFAELLDGYKDFADYRAAAREQESVRRKLAEAGLVQQPVVGNVP